MRERCETVPKALKTARVRLLAVGGFFIIIGLVIATRLVSISLLSKDPLQPVVKMASAPTPASLRAEIRDRNGVLLATTLRTASVYADPKQILDPVDAARKLKTVLSDQSEAELLARLKEDKRFVWLRRNVTPPQEYAINKLGIPGIDFRYEDQRFYPSAALAAHVVGYTDRDGNGIAGIEKHFDERLKQDDTPLALSIDTRLQHILRREAANAKKAFNGIGAAGVIMDVRTGEVLAMTSLPDFDPNEPGDKNYESLDFNPKFNRNTLGVYEMGSTFKLLTAAMALESGKVKLSDKFDAAQPIKIGRFTINDYHPEGRALSVPEIIKESSNIGTARMALAAGTENQRNFLDSLGLLKQAQLEVPELGRPLLPKPWGEVSTMTVSFGHGISITPIQMVTAVSAVVNGGTLHPATLVKVDDAKDLPSKTILSEATSRKLRKLMRLVVTDGTGKKADVPGYLVGGKTGTAEKVMNGVYNHKALISSFVGVFPAHDPRYLVMIMVDEPKPNKESFGYATGGWVAAPAVSRVIAEIGPLLGVAPVDENAPDIIESMALPGYDHDSRTEKTKGGGTLASYKH